MKNQILCSLLFVGTTLTVAANREVQDRRIPVPPITTTLGSMPGVDALPVRGEMPDVMVLNSGQRVTTAAQWRQRREEMKQILSYYAVGRMPPPPGNVKGTLLATRPVLDGAVQYQLVHLSFGPDQKLGFDIAVFVPAAKKTHHPTVVYPSFSLTPGAKPLPTMPRPPEQGRGVDALTLPLGDPSARIAAASSAAQQQAPAPLVPDPEQAASANAELFRRGYALVTYHYQDAGEDTIGRNIDGSWAFRSTRFFPAYPNYDWGLLGSWAWGIARVADYLQAQSYCEKKQLIAIGHSRIGKAVLVAGAFDERLSVVAPAGSGAGGTGAYRFNGAGHGGKEGLDDMMRKYPNWFSPHLYEFAGHTDRLPFDQHWFMALATPRAFVSLEGIDDQNCVPNALKQAWRNAMPAYAIFKAESRLGVNFANHRHALTAEDWTALLDFADLRLRGRRIERHFDQFPPDSPPSAPPPAQTTTARTTWNVLNLGARGDGRTKDTLAFQTGLDRAAGGGEVVVPAGTYLIGSIVLKSNTKLRLAKGATLVGSPDLDDYPPTKVRWEGRWVDGRRALISARDAENIAIVGPGHIAGNPALGSRQMPGRAVLIEPIECKDVLLEDFSTEHTSMWSIHPTYCENFTARRLTIRSTGGDGIDVDSCRHVVIEYCDIDTGDDAIAIKSGRGMEGYRIARPTEDVLISHCTLGDRNFACIGIGSETSGGIRNVRIEHCRFTHAKTYAIYIKSRPGRGAYIEDIVAQDLEIANAAGFLRFNLTDSGLQDPEPVPGEEGIPRTRNFRFENVKITGGTLVDGASVPAEKPLDGLFIAHISGTCAKGMSLANIRNVELRDISVTGIEGPLLAIRNVTGTGLEGAMPLRLTPVPAARPYYRSGTIHGMT